MEQRPQPGIQDSSNLTPTYDFAHISPAILELITHFLNGYDILALCMTCSKPLFARIRAGGAVRFSIGPTDVSAWSADGFGMLQYFPRLTTISIRQSSLKVWKIGPKIFNVFPPTVRSISLLLPISLGEWLLIGADQLQTPLVEEAEDPEIVSSPEAPETSSEATPSSPVASKPKRAPPKRNKRRKAPTPEVGALPTVAQVIAKQTAPVSSSSPSKARNMHLVPHFHLSRQFPSLEVLEVSGGLKYSLKRLETPFFGESAQGLAKSRFVASLPATMQRVSLPEMGIFAWTVPASLPPTLSQLDLVAEEIDAPDGAARNFPKDLQYLTLATQQKLDAPRHGRIFLDLPTALEKLDWTYSRTGSVNPVLSVLTDLICLPNLVHLELDLDLGQSHLNNSVSSPGLENWFSYLPRRLETLKVNGRALVSKNCLWSSLPASLTFLHLYALTIDFTDGGQWPVGKWEGFPPCLTDLKLGGYLVMRDPDFEALPRSLTRLCLETHQCSFSHSCSDLGHGNGSACDLMRMLGRRDFGLTDAAALLLPSSLESLTLHSTIFGANFWSNLPETLTHLDMATMQSLSASDLASLPLSLTHLRVYQAPNVHASIFAQLPHSLVKLEISDGQVFEQTPKAVAQLPPNLKHLLIERFIFMRDQYVISLPRGLTVLHLPHSGLLTARCAPDLPKSLQQLTLKRIYMPTDNPIVTKAALSRDMPPWLPIDDLPWVIGKSHRKLDLRDYFLHQEVSASSHMSGSSHEGPDGGTPPEE
jgi:hypothetical protein